MESETNRFWLPHFIIDRDKVVFLNKYDMGIQVSSQLNAHIEDGIITKNLKEILSQETIRQLLLNGVVVPWKNQKKESSGRKKKRALVIQPHSDDVAFSCSGSIQYYIEKEEMEVDLLTVFSRSKYRDSPWSRYFELDDLSYQNIRKQEDELLSKYLGCNLIYLDYKDANFRSKMSVISKSGLLKQDLQIKELFKHDLSELLHKINPQLIFLPIGIGAHRDHLAVYTACMELFKELSFSGRIYLYEDYPYCNSNRYSYFSRLYEVHKRQKIQQVFVDIQDYLASKTVIINFYRSQFVNTSFKQIQEDISDFALSVNYEGRLQNKIKNKEFMYAESLWKMSQ